MNKKFSTLLAGAALVAAVSANAQNLAFFEHRNGRFVEGIACFVKDNLSY